ncbi:MAG: hypothetical protein LBD30_02675, partial [Verrucomicrobiales bacterium]|nr:hypothetical protein [Verrucomicrobiales bacterium]
MREMEVCGGYTHSIPLGLPPQREAWGHGQRQISPADVDVTLVGSLGDDLRGNKAGDQQRADDEQAKSPAKQVHKRVTRLLAKRRANKTRKS